ncbi:ATP-grasp domain-containing protein [Clostridium oryzae]|uniref:Alpha-aminoadipate--LysW ligase LysX n=1 Tax=Clostridium oryzae TaxID=1450648 RepID=A0A1V4IRH0_9CLOT|nr:RimK family alpha-L-glutamate ligase [Clostridium oryzae]OPJ62404.1 alpha-aminoadipate--LysW ligase LysX [Clostridium oryzae]
MNKTGWLIYTKSEAIRNEGFIKIMLSDAEKLDMDLQLRYREDFAFGIKDNVHFVAYKGCIEKMRDFVIMRDMAPMFTEQIEKMGVKVFNNSFTSRICNNKALLHQYMASFHIPMMDTYFFSKGDYITGNMKFDFPVVVKAVSGRGGKQVFKADDMKQLMEITDSIEDDIIVQKMGEVPGRDVRVFVIGRQIIAAILRSSDDDFRANFSLGGSARLYELNEKQKELIHKIIEKFEFGMVGIDFIFDIQGNFILNEIEDVVGSRTLYKNSNIDIAKMYLEYIKNC